MKKEKDESYIFSRFVFFCLHDNTAFTNGLLGKV